MSRVLIVVVFVISALGGCAAGAGNTGDPMPFADDSPWDASRVARIVDAAREARRQGDLAAAERLCYTTFLTVDRHALDGLDAYADLLASEHRPEAGDARAHAVQLRALKTSQMKGTEPASTYMGFSPVEALNAYADLLQGHVRPDESRRMRSLALAYQQVQQAHFQRTLLYRQGKDPRGAC